MTVEPQTDALLQLHIAEYTALTTRNTYYMSVSFAIWPALVLYLTLFGILKGWESYGVLLALLAVFGTELLGAGWYFCLYEQYQNVLYMETKLRPKVAELIPQTDYWAYEGSRHPAPSPSMFINFREGLSRLIGDIWAGLLILPPVLYMLCKFKPRMSLTPECYVWVLSLVAMVGLVALMLGTMITRITLERELHKRAAAAKAVDAIKKDSADRSPEQSHTPS
jgi:hypothetical protein